MGVRTFSLREEVRTGLSIRLNMSDDTEFEANEDNFKSDMINANEDVQKWIDEQEMKQEA